ncbi:hypothetical protein D9M73_97160 [compost metagenome]
MRIERLARACPIARRDLRQRQVQRHLPVAIVERQHIGEDIARRGKATALQIALAKQQAIGRNLRLIANRRLGMPNRNVEFTM